MAELAHHPRSRLAREPADPADGPVGVLDHGLHPRVAQEPVQRGAADDGPVLDEGVGVAFEQSVQLRMDDDGRPILVGGIGELNRAQGHEGVGTPGTQEPLGPLVGHDRDLVPQAVERARDHGSRGARQLGIEPESTSAVRVAVLEPSFTLSGDRVLLDPFARPQIADATDRP